VKQTSENKLFNSSLSLFVSKKLVNQLSQNNLCHQIRFNSIQIQINLVSLLQRCCQCNDLSTHIALSISESIYLVFLCQLVSLLQWHDQNQPLWWASRFSSSESATKTLSMQWSIYSHRSIYQWIDLPRVSTSNSESATIDISMIWKINRKIDRRTSVKLYVSAMNYITSHRNMIFKEKKVMLRSVSTLNRV